MQWIYGGAWILGDAREFGYYDGKKLASRHGVIIVAANYRIDALGWLALEELDQESGANFGLSDQRLAMQWAQRNIERFGGLANEVTIFGESAGGFSVCQHITAPASNHLFSHAIIESGDCDGPWLITSAREAKRFGDVYASAIGCPASAKSGARLACLRDRSLRDVMVPYADWLCKWKRSQDPWCFADANASSATAPQAWPHPRPPFAPIVGFMAVVDGREEGLPEVPLASMLKGRINTSPQGRPISVIMGTNTDEAALFMATLPLVFDGAKLPITHDTIHTALASLIAYHDHWNATTLAQVEANYPVDSFATPASRFTTMGTDFLFRCGTRTAARALSAAGIDTYLYQFDFHHLLYRDPASKACEHNSEFLCGIYHAAEVGHVWGNGLDLRAADRTMTTTMQALWTNMAKGGSPNGPTPTGVIWPRYNATTDLHLRLAHEVTVGEGLAKYHCDFWDSLPRQTSYPTS